ncbi:MAG: VCBS repeat-containing protein [Acidobacteria bacterium]|nr:VCBS repeat-containing protein [Acidobacteriota bacterium]
MFSFILLTMFGLTAAGAGELDPTLTASAYGSVKGTVYVARVQPDGKVLIGGNFMEVNGFAASGLARLNPDGSVDTSFSGPDFFSFNGLGADVTSIVLQSDGKILVAGSIFGADGGFNRGVRRLNPDGSLDPTWTITNFQGGVYDLDLQPDGKVILGGSFSPNPTAPNTVRLNTDGTFDFSFTPPATSTWVTDLAVQPDGKIVVGTNTSVGRLNADGSVDNTFTAVNTGIQGLQIRPDGKVLIVGAFTAINGTPVGRIALLNQNGTLDPAFNAGNPGADNWIGEIALRPDGKILVAGGFSLYNNVSRSKTALLNADGTLDGSFQDTLPLASSTINDVELLPDNRFYVGISAQADLGPALRFGANGSYDPAFAPVVTRNGKVNRLLEQPDHKILAAGDFPLVNGVRRNGLARLNADGSLDTSFVPYFNDQISYVLGVAVALQPDGKILFSAPNSVGLVRLNADGSRDTSFNPNFTGTVNDVAVLSDGRFIVGGDMTDNGGLRKGILRLNANGTVDSGFAPPLPNNLLWTVKIQPDGKILIGGEFTMVGQFIRGRIARYTADGALDNTFNPPGGASSSVVAVAVQADGKIVLGGGFTGLNGSTSQVSIGRLNADGTLDAGFVQTTNGAVNSIGIQADGKILIAGTMSTVGTDPHVGIARLNVDGTLDSSFNATTNGYGQTLSLQADGKILLGGTFSKVNRRSAVRIARLLNAPAAPPRRFFDYDGDGRADVSVFRASENKWYILRSSDFGVTQTVFAIPNDIPVPADYDGDGKTDVAIFRPSSGAWWYLSSISNAQINVNFGQAGDIPRPSDYDGDGKTDFIVYRPSNSVWYRFSATGQTSIIAFGSAGDQPVTGDFDGDGKSDPAIYRPSTGDWWYASSITGQFLAVHWGQTGDVPAPADFDGDGKTDFAIFRPSDGGWFVSRSSNGTFISTSFGTLGDKPIPADYDGDGKADIAVFRPSTGVWYLLQTTSGFGALQWGIATDTPTENAFVP